MFSNLYLEKSLNAAKVSIGIKEDGNNMDVDVSVSGGTANI